jgi:hypothetical protein
MKVHCGTDEHVWSFSERVHVWAAEDVKSAAEAAV